MACKLTRLATLGCFGLVWAFLPRVDAQTLLVDPAGDGGFENGTTLAANGWVEVNGTQTNKWFLGTAATGYQGARCAYISSDPAGATHTYSTTVNSTVHFYRDITIPSGHTTLTIKFRWKNYGEGPDFLQVALCPAGTPVTAGSNSVNTYALGNTLKGFSSWQTTTLTVSCQSGTKRLVFTWKNNNSLGTQPPAAIDSISVVSSGGATACSSVLGTGVVNVTSLPYTSIGRSTAGAVNDLTSTTAYVCGTNTYYGCEDEVFIFTPATSGTVTATISNSSSWYSAIYLYSACPATTSCSGATCLAFSQSFSTGKSICASLTAGVTYYLVVDGNTLGGTAFTYDISISAPGAASGTVCSNAIPVTLPFTATAQSTSCATNDYHSGVLGACVSNYQSGEDRVYSYTASGPQCIVITLSNVSSNLIGCQVYSACPGSGTGICVATFNGPGAHSVTLPAAGTYYIIVDSWSPPSSVTYDISITAGSTTVGTTCANAIPITLPYYAYGQTTACAGNDYNNAVLGSCGSIYESGEDRVYAYTTTSAECISVTLSNMSSNFGGFMVYSACPGTGTGICLGWFGGPGTRQVSLPGPGTYYIIVDSWAPPSAITYDLSVISMGSGQPNDLPCNAINLPIGVLTAGNNSCSSGTGEPSNTNCFGGGALNTVWYSFVAPSSSVKVGFQNGSLVNAAIQLYGGSCNSLTYISCANSTTLACPGALFTGLTPGATYYLRLDGSGDAVGYYQIVVDNGTGPFTPTSADCEGALDVCGTTFTNADNSNGCGNIQDVTGTCTVSNPCTNPASSNWGCWLSGELNVRFFKLQIQTSGTLAWTLSGTGTGFFDWLLWDITTQGCAGIKNNTLPPVRCNWNASSIGMTGMQSTVPPGGVPGNFEQPLNVTAGQTYILGISNWSYVIPAYNLDFSNSTCVIGSSTTAVWTGAVGTAWNQTANWAGCGTPSCGIDAIIDVAANQPIIGSNATVRNLTIEPGATLTINAGVTLSICGNLTNNGTIIASPSSTIQFIGTGAQAVTGNFSGTSKLGNVVVTKTSGTVDIMQDMEIAGNLTTSNATSVINLNNKNLKIGGNVTIHSGATTLTGTGSSTITFNGANNQNYSPGGTINIGTVVIDKPAGTAVVLYGNLNVTSNLTLTSGRITTGLNEVHVSNTSTTAITGGSTASYVDGYLRRNIAATGSYDFPVGHHSSGKGFQKINFNFTSAVSFANLLVSFQPYVTVPGPLNVSDCGYNYNMQALNNGYWTAVSSAPMTSGAYTVTLFNTAGTYTNNGGATQWTVMKNNGTGWHLNGTCATSTIGQVVRTGLVGFSDFGTAQSSTNLPVELVSFTGSVYEDGNLLQWQTLSEENNAYFHIERSSDGHVFSRIGTVRGQGTSTQQNDYTFWDRQPLAGNNYYRLQQEDFSGHVTYSHVIVLETKMKPLALLQLSPNPTSGDLTITLHKEYEGHVLLEITDLFGKTVISDKIKATGVVDYRASLKGLPAGIYQLCLRATERDQLVLAKLVLQ
ncbi:MAG: hypothetical protein NZL95_04705 [Chitinophagales bacterium]|nr:hypothetical protein [Chitinophagales bacterium]MDW8427833.1 T9SS type A sorting domain-containing protein [Chitinophagales bacterium]